MAPNGKQLLKQMLIQKAMKQKLAYAGPAGDEVFASEEIPRDFFDFQCHPAYRQVLAVHESAQALGIQSPYFKLHEGIAGSTTRIGGRQYINFANYNYLNLNGHPQVRAAAGEAIERYGTSVSASRSVAGERPVHRELEMALADACGVDSAIVFVSGHATNVTTIGYLFGRKDLILHDELIHNSILQGARLSGAGRMAFPHNDWSVLDDLLKAHRPHFARVLIVLEGLYSMDGDYPDLPRFVELKNRHKAFLMVDEAHSFGVMGNRGLGIREHFGISGREVDIWMGTLSKALAGCGGFIAGEHALVDHLKYLAPGFLSTVISFPYIFNESHS